ncbi:hypothetical protein TWF730_009509 [Orbilia blumenaviensis]|uniref:U3 small nucleolar RNA-associated protein 22 n=1 Tax=Orbilia blumenaviensis TaxID=1796055 RepID=A0AAV9UYS9_9PEZI
MKPEIQSSNPRKRKLFESGLNDAHSLPLSITDFIKYQKCSAKEAAQITQTVNNIKQVLVCAEETKFDSIQDAKAAFCSHGAHIPYPECGDDIYGAPVFLSPPARIESELNLGHHILRKPGHDDAVVVDLIIQVPPITFHPKDYLEYRYLRKRILYLSYLTVALRGSTETQGYSFSHDFLDGDELRPTVLVDCLHVVHSKCRIRLIPAIPHDLFPIDRLSPNACWADRLSGVPTPMYNSSLVDDAHHLGNFELLRQHITSNEEFKGALVLGSTWLSRLGFSSHMLDGGFGKKEWALLQLHLVEGNVDTHSSSKYAASSDPFQIFKSVLNLIINTRLHPQTGTPTLCQTYTQYNILFKMSRWSFLALRHHSSAVVSLERSGLSSLSQFHRIFQNPFCQIYDITASFRIDTLQIMEKLPSTTARRWNLQHSINDYCYDILSKGLGDRYKTMVFCVPKPPLRHLENVLGSEKPDHDPYNLCISFTLDEKTCMRILEYGPGVQDTRGSTDFREFWGDMAELRRFKDGRVMETVKWDATPSPTEQILGFLHRKLTSPFQTKQPPIFHGCDSEIYLTTPPLIQPPGDLYETAISEFQTVVNSIRQVNDFPLGFRKITGISPALSLTSVKPPLSCSRYLEAPLEGELDLESSSMWPVDPEQRRRSEFGLLLKLRAELEASGRFLTARVGITTTRNSDNTYCFLDLLTKSRYYFRFRLKDAMDITPNGLNINPQIGPSLDTRNERLINTKQTFNLQESAVQKCHQHQFFAPSLRILGKWIQSHYLGLFFGNAILELFVAAVFSPYFPVAIPSSTYCGFRRVIAYLSCWDWRRTPLEVDVLRQFTDGERTQILKEFRADSWTNQGSEACLSVVLASEDGRVDWIRHRIPRLVAIRMTQLARETHSRLSDVSTPFNAVFDTDMAFFDFVIVLNQKYELCDSDRRYSNVVMLPKTNVSSSLYASFIRELRVLLRKLPFINKKKSNNNDNNNRRTPE